MSNIDLRASMEHAAKKIKDFLKWLKLVCACPRTSYASFILSETLLLVIHQLSKHKPDRPRAVHKPDHPDLATTSRAMKRKAEGGYREEPLRWTPPPRGYNSSPNLAAGDDPGTGRFQGQGHQEGSGRGRPLPLPRGNNFQHGHGFPRGPPRGTFYGGPHGAQHPNSGANGA